MSTFEVKVIKIDAVEEHPNADRLTVVTVGGYKCIANKKEDGGWRYHAGDLAVYIPEQAVLPESLLKFMGFWDAEKNVGTLAGKGGDRVKPLKLRGIFSQGLLMPVGTLNGNHYVDVGDGSMLAQIGVDISRLLGITKWEPPIPINMAGEVANISGKTVKYDIENWQKYPHVLKEGEEVVVTEKLHGTFCCIGYWPGLNHDELFYDGNLFTYSKGLGAQGLVFKNNANNDRNLYVRFLRSFIEHGKADMLKTIASGAPVYIMGEIFGKGVQDLTYGLSEPKFSIFDVFVGPPTTGAFLAYPAMVGVSEMLGLETVPFLYKGPYSKEMIAQLRDGNSTLTGNQIREGAVVKTVTERSDLEIGRVILKYVSPAYLTRKGDATEYN